MEYISDNEISVKQEEEHLFRLLDRGLMIWKQEENFL